MQQNVKVLSPEEMTELRKSVNDSHRITTPTEISTLDPEMKAAVGDDEVVISMDDPKNFRAAFGTLQHLNAIMTNKCNLSCTYCFEQHRKDFGSWTNDKLLQAFRFLTRSSVSKKAFQFFGGEPLLQSRRILSFLEEHKEEIEREAIAGTQVRIITNGLKLSQEFINKFLSLRNTHILLSLDTLQADYDHRGIPQEDIEKILDWIKYAADIRSKTHPSEGFPVSIRCTISPETSPQLPEFFDRLVSVGVDSITVHPLTMSLGQGFVEWDEDRWNQMYLDIRDALTRHPNLTLTFSEGVGNMGAGHNCMVGHGMLAIDAAGDFSGCYFFNNLKEGVGHTMLGNLFDGTIYAGRYKAFHEAYMKLFDHPECQSCKVQGLCYQCPAGNVSTGGQLYQPDSMCKKVVDLHLLIQRDASRKEGHQMLKKFRQFADDLPYENAEERAVCTVMLNLMHFKITGKPVPDEVREAIPSMLENLKPDSFWRIFSAGTHAEVGSFSPVQTLSDMEKFIRAMRSGEVLRNIIIEESVWSDLLSQYDIAEESVPQELPTSKMVIIVFLHYIIFNIRNKEEPTLGELLGG